MLRSLKASGVCLDVSRVYVGKARVRKTAWYQHRRDLPRAGTTCVLLCFWPTPNTYKRCSFPGSNVAWHSSGRFSVVSSKRATASPRGSVGCATLTELDEKLPCSGTRLCPTNRVTDGSIEAFAGRRRTTTGGGRVSTRLAMGRRTQACDVEASDGISANGGNHPSRQGKRGWRSRLGSRAGSKLMLHQGMRGPIVFAASFAKGWQRIAIEGASRKL